MSTMPEKAKINIIQLFFSSDGSANTYRIFVVQELIDIMAYTVINIAIARTLPNQVNAVHFGKWSSAHVKI